MYAKSTILGRLGADATSRTTPTGTTVSTLSVAVNERWTNKSTKQVTERTDWFRIICFGGLAETVAKYCKKGQVVLVEGRPQVRRYEAPSGEQRTSFEIIAQRVVFISRPAGHTQSDGPTTAEDSTPPPIESGAPEVAETTTEEGAF